MSIKTICFTGMDSAESAALKVLFADANRRSGEAWSLIDDVGADMVVVDVDSMYGHMTWLRIHHSGSVVVALSSNHKADADHVLLRPVTADALAQLLADHGGGNASVRPAKPAPAPIPAPEPVAAPAPAAVVEPIPEPVIAPVAAIPAVPAAPVAPPRDPMLTDYLLPGALPGPVKLQLGDAPPLVIDPQTRTYLGPTALKAFLPYGKAVIRQDDWIAITPHDLERMKAELGGVQPFQRLQWLAGLVASDGKLAHGYDPNQKYKLLKWPQIEREFPKHFRIATAMMKGPQLLTEIAEASTVPLAEVTDFVNANLAAGMAEMEQPTPAADPNAPAAKGGLLGRLRGK
jgi:hypothetical protein